MPARDASPLRAMKHDAAPHRAPFARIDHFLVIGAGASKGAREAWGCAPPVGDELAAYLLDWLCANGCDDRRSFAARLDESNDELPSNDLYSGEFLAVVESFLRRARDRGDFERELAGLFRAEHAGKHPALTWGRFNRLLAQAMLCGRRSRFEEGPDLYDELLRRHLVARPSTTAVISFNYDILIEEAAARLAGRSVEQAVHYPDIADDDGHADRLVVFKPHGSVNWMQTNDHVGGSATPCCIETRPAGPSVFEDRIVGLATGGQYVAMGTRRGIVLEAKHLESTPILALYMGGKPVTSNQPAVDRHRAACLEAVRANRTAAVTVIGLRSPTSPGDDPFLEQLLDAVRACAGPREYVNPSADERAHSATLGFTPVEATLSAHLARR